MTGTFHVSTCEMLELMTLSARIGSLNSICIGESPHIYLVYSFPRSRGSILTLQMNAVNGYILFPLILLFFTRGSLLV